MEYVRIPQRRIGVLIGHDGETRKEFEVATGCTLEIDSRTGIVRVVQPERGVLDHDQPPAAMAGAPTTGEALEEVERVGRWWPAR